MITRRLIISSVIGGLSGSRLVLATRPYPATTDDHPAREPACSSAVKGAQAGSLATVELRHQQGHDLAPGSPWGNGYRESFNGKLNGECFKQEIFY